MYHHPFSKHIKCFRRGSFKYLVLYVLKDKPMHGYDISKAISNLFRGIYEPSPGLLYPTLKRLEKQKLISSKIEDDKKVYYLTSYGLQVLKRKESKIVDMLSELNSFLDSGTIDLIKSIKSLLWIIELYYPEMDSEKISKVCEVLKNARRSIESIFEGG